MDILPFTVMSSENLFTFFRDFEINWEIIKSKNEKFHEIIAKKIIDEFEFVQMIHLLSV